MRMCILIIYIYVYSLLGKFDFKNSRTYVLKRQKKSSLIFSLFNLK